MSLLKNAVEINLQQYLRGCNYLFLFADHARLRMHRSTVEFGTAQGAVAVVFDKVHRACIARLRGIEGGEESRSSWKRATAGPMCWFYVRRKSSLRSVVHERDARGKCTGRNDRRHLANRAHVNSTHVARVIHPSRGWMHRILKNETARISLTSNAFARKYRCDFGY